ncbi:VOC family protein [Candidatus Enterococcus murrayae]|uniref:VOC family protein n=1 Tax=Candidatus Enterococcus murrayae TaxID=2815321 RepID=A0ABS3HED0_9ENTE|nr:VOC family protein [Enterococcus sp. MJM16]MBO0451352.1 VOC family protein [Enterococcus sp. MJM16]
MTVIIPTFQLSAATHIGNVALKVANLKKMTRFYQEVIGLQVIDQSAVKSTLGVGETVLLELHKVQNPLPVTPKTGLYHVAFLLPSRKDLGNALFHYLNVKAPLIGASDHGYSEALYLNDPEGNGIEVYHDKPQNEWDIREDGEIVGVTLEMDAEGVLAAGDRTWTGFPIGSSVGHVHLKVADLPQTEKFFTEVLGLSLKNNFGNQAKFFATGEYHHHIGSNIWLGKNIPAMTDKDLGLDYFSFSVPNQAELDRLENHWKNQIEYTKDETGSLWVVDPNGITMKFER